MQDGSGAARKRGPMVDHGEKVALEEGFTLNQLKALEQACRAFTMVRGPMDPLVRSSAFSTAYAKVCGLREKAEVLT